MRYLLSAAILAGLLGTAPVHAEDDEATLRVFKTELWPRAYRTGDAALLDRLLHASFEMIDSDGQRSTKAEELERVRDSKWDPGSFEYRIERLSIYADSVAIIAGTGIAESYTYKSSNVLIKEDGRWQAIASHVSGVQDRASGSP